MSLFRKSHQIVNYLCSFQFAPNFPMTIVSENLDPSTSLAEIEEIAQAVKDIASGAVSLEEADRKISIIEGKKMVKERETREKVEDLLRYGKPGKGISDDYEFWCRGCHTEYSRSDVTHCERCGSGKLVSKSKSLFHW